MANMSAIGDTPRVLESYDDVEDSIHDLADEAWRTADYIASSEPLQAKQQWEEVRKLFNALDTYVSNLSDQTPEDKK